MFNKYSLVVLVVGLVVVASVSGLPGRHRTIPRHPEYRDHTLDLLPNIADHQIMAQLRCSSCLGISHLLHKAFRDALTAPGHKHTTRKELIHVIDNICVSLHNTFGLVVDGDGVTTTDFSQSSDKERLQGIWINEFIKKRCAEMLIHHEERIIDRHPEAHTEAHLQTFMCVDWEKSCNASAVERDKIMRRSTSTSQSLRLDEL